MTWRGVVGVMRRVRSPTRKVLTKQPSGGGAAASSNMTIRRSGASSPVRPSSRVLGAALRSAGNRSRAAKAAAATWTQAGAWQVQRLFRATWAPDGFGSSVTVCFVPAWSTVAEITSPCSTASTSPTSSSVRPRVRVRASNTRPRSSEENGVGIG